VWAQAGLHFYLESLVREEAVESFASGAISNQRSGLLGLRPTASMASNLFHIYYLKEMLNNGIYFPEAIFVKDTASLRRVPGGIDEPIPRVTSHELGHAFGLPHRQDNTNLMASGTTGTWLNNAEIRQVREAARQFKWIESAPELRNKAAAFSKEHRMKEAAELYLRLAGIPQRANRAQKDKP
jgi:hypothetical protein